MVANQSNTTTSIIPPLENGDRLTRDEFERRYAAMPHLKKAELIEGVVYVPAALRFRSHGQPHGQIMTWLGVYQAFTPKVELGDNPDLVFCSLLQCIITCLALPKKIIGCIS